MANTFKAGLIQTNVSNDMAENVAFVQAQTRLARDAGADFIMTPENTGLIGANRTETLEKAQTEASHGMLAACRASARETGAWFLLGGLTGALLVVALGWRRLTKPPDLLVRALKQTVDDQAAQIRALYAESDRMALHLIETKERRR